MTHIRDIKEIYKKEICGSNEMCKNCKKRLSLDIYSVGRETENFSVCTIFRCKRLKNSKTSDKIS